MHIKPTPEEAMRRLRLDSDLSDDVQGAIEAAHAEAVAFLDGQLYEDLDAMANAMDIRGIVATFDIIAAQLLLVDVLIGNNTQADRESKHAAALTMLRRHRNQGA